MIGEPIKQSAKSIENPVKSTGEPAPHVTLVVAAPQSAVACIDSKANVCSVQFSPVNSNLMAFGSANYRVYLYDLRNIQVRARARACGWARALKYGESKAREQLSKSVPP